MSFDVIFSFIYTELIDGPMLVSRRKARTGSGMFVCFIMNYKSVQMNAQKFNEQEVILCISRETPLYTVEDSQRGTREKRLARMRLECLGMQ